MCIIQTLKTHLRKYLMLCVSLIRPQHKTELQENEKNSKFKSHILTERMDKNVTNFICSILLGYGIFGLPMYIVYLKNGQLCGNDLLLSLSFYLLASITNTKEVLTYVISLLSSICVIIVYFTDQYNETISFNSPILILTLVIMLSYTIERFYRHINLKEEYFDIFKK